ncbi:MAG: ferritin [Clostridiaceae bacterium]
MGMSEKLKDMFNQQIKHEYDSRNVYFGIESYLRKENWDGFGNFFNIQADEEMVHCRFFMEYLAFVGENWEMRALEAQTNEYSSVLDVFQAGLKHEKFITSKIHDLYDQAVADKDYHAQKFLDWYIQEQAEEENHFESWLAKIERAQGGPGMALLDQEAAARMFTFPTTRPVPVL